MSIFSWSEYPIHDTMKAFRSSSILLDTRNKNVPTQLILIHYHSFNQLIFDYVENLDLCLY